MWPIKVPEMTQKHLSGFRRFPASSYVSNRSRLVEAIKDGKLLEVEKLVFFKNDVLNEKHNRTVSTDQNILLRLCVKLNGH